MFVFGLMNIMPLLVSPITYNKVIDKIMKDPTFYIDVKSKILGDVLRTIL